MAIDLQNPTNISTGWGPPPQFHAPEIGGLVGHILQNRILQRAQQDKEIADAIKQYQTQREDDAYIKAAQATGVLPAGDYGELGAKGGGDIARLIELQRQRTAQAGLYSSEEDKNRAMADWIRSGKPLSGPDTGGWTDPDPTNPFYIDPQTGAVYRKSKSARGVVNLIPTPMGIQPTSAKTVGPTQTPEYQLQKNYQLDPEELYQWSPEYGMATLDAKGKPDPNTFTPTAPGTPGTSQGQNQPWVRVTKADGGQVVMPRAEYERFKGQLMPQEYYGNQGQAQPSASPSPSATPPGSVRVRPDASKSAPVNPPNKPVTPGEQIDEATVQQYILKNNGDRDAARADARADGWTF